MANKKKKVANNRHKTQQKKQQRRSARLQKKQGPGGPPQAAQFRKPSISVLEDVAPLLSNGEALEPDNPNIDELYELAFESEHLIEEPEFDEISTEAFETVATYIKIAQSKGLNPEEFDASPSAATQEALADTFDELCQRMLTNQLRQEFITALTALRKRLKSEDDEDGVLAAAAVQLFLETDKDGTLAGNLGLVQAVMRRSLHFGFTVAGASLEMEELADARISERERNDRFAESSTANDFAKTVEQIPGLNRYLDRQIDKISEDGLKAVFTGELPLDIYTDEEIEGAVQIGIELYKEIGGPLDERFKFLEAMADRLMPKLTEYIETLFTPLRLDDLRDYWDDLLEDPQLDDSKWKAFLMMKQKDFETDDAPEYEMRFLATALLAPLVPLLYKRLKEMKASGR